MHIYTQFFTNSLLPSIHTFAVVIGFEAIAYMTSEGKGHVELCAVTSRPVERRTMASFSVTGGTATGTGEFSHLQICFKFHK